MTFSELLDTAPMNLSIQDEQLMLVRQVSNFYYNLLEDYERPFAEKPLFYHNKNEDENGEPLLDFHYPHEVEWQAIRDFLNNLERVDKALAQMRHIFENTSTEDRYYSTRKAGFESLSAFKAGTYHAVPRH